MDQNEMSSEEELAVYKGICRLPLRVDEIKVLMKRTPMEHMVEHRLDLCQANMLAAWLTSEIRRYKMSYLCGNKNDSITDLLSSIDV